MSRALCTLPVFWGQGGGKVMQEFLGGAPLQWPSPHPGSYRCVQLLPPDHEYHQEPKALANMASEAL